MATITSATSGDSNVWWTWIWWIVPVVGDGVVIAAWHTVTLVTTHNWWDDTTTDVSGWSGGNPWANTGYSWALAEWWHTGATGVAIIINK